MAGQTLIVSNPDVKPIGFVYLWYDRKRKMFCLGSHLGTEDDGYVTGTGGERFKRAYKKRSEDFKRRIIELIYEDSPRTIRPAEQRWLDMIKPEELGVRYYNIKLAAVGFDSATARKNAIARFAKPEEREANRARQKKRFANQSERDKARDAMNLALARPEVRQNMSYGQLRRYQDNDQKDKQRRCGSLVSHNRWHVIRGIINDSCLLCLEAVEALRPLDCPVNDELIFVFEELTPEERRIEQYKKIANSLRGRKLSEEHRRATSVGQIGLRWWLTPEGEKYRAREPRDTKDTNEYLVSRGPRDPIAIAKGIESSRGFVWWKTADGVAEYKAREPRHGTDTRGRKPKAV